MKSMLSEITQKCVVFVLYTACINSCMVLIAHEHAIAKDTLLLLAANMGASMLTANVLLFRLDRMVVGNAVSNRVMVLTLAPAVAMVVLLSCMRFGKTELPVLFALGYFGGIAAGSFILSLITATG